jgi:hypothetical protein
MRKAMFFIFVVVGAAVGLASALTDDWGVKPVMMTIGAVTGAAIGGAISGITARGRKKLQFDSEALPGLGTTPTDMMDCRRRSNIDPPCRSNTDPGMDAGRVTANC